MTKKTESPQLSSADCVAALRKSFPTAEYAFFEQVPNGVGWSKTRSADALVLSLWPSRGLLLHGFEIKVARQDWLRELKHPAKADAIATFCDRWSIVAPKGLVRPDELPPTWGLYEVDEKRAGRFAVKAPELTPEPLTKSFLAAVLRKQSDDADTLRRITLSEGREQGAAEGAGSLMIELSTARSRLADLQARVEEFEKKSGLRLDDWELGNVAAAVRTLVDNAYRLRSLEVLRQEEVTFTRQIAHLREEISCLESIGKAAAE